MIKIDWDYITQLTAKLIKIPSVNSSHHYERTHKDGIIKTIRLLIAIL